MIYFEAKMLATTNSRMLKDIPDIITLSFFPDLSMMYNMKTFLRARLEEWTDGHTGAQDTRGQLSTHIT